MVSARIREQVRMAAEVAWTGPQMRVQIGEPVTGELLEALAAEHEVWLEAGRPGEIVARGPAGGLVSQVSIYLAVLWMLALFLRCHSTTETLNLTV